MRPLLAALCVSVSFVQASSASAGPTVIELFTSQGCSSCPPADAMLVELAGKDDLVSLSWHVDYWDYLGWADDLADPSYTKRQQAYAQAAGSRTVYTPQMVIGGVDHVIGSRPMEVMDQLQAHAASDYSVEIELTRRGDRLSIEATASEAYAPAQVEIIRFHPEIIRNIRRGENAGRTITYANVVYSLTDGGRWDMASPLTLEAVLSGPEPVVVLVRHAESGKVLGAAQLR